MPSEQKFNKSTLTLPPVVSMLAGRGGTGKTSVSVNVAALVAEGGKNVLIIDLDLSGQGATYLLTRKAARPAAQTVISLLDRFFSKGGSKSTSAAKDIWRDGLPNTSPALLKNFEAAQVKGALHFLPARSGGLDSMRRTIGDYSSLSVETICSAVAGVMEEAAKTLDLNLIVIDGPGTSDNFAIAAARLSDYCVLVTQPDPVSRQATRDLEGHIWRSINKEEMPQISWVVNKVTYNYSKATVDAIFEGTRVLASIPHEDKIAAAYGAVPFARELGFSNFEIKLHAVCSSLFEGEHRDLIPEPIKMLPEQQLHKLQTDLRKNTGTVGTLLRWTTRGLLVCATVGFAALLYAVFVGGPRSVSVDRATGGIVGGGDSIPIPPTTAAWFALGAAVLSGLAWVVSRLHQRKAATVETDTTRLIREMLLSTDKNALIESAE